MLLECAAQASRSAAQRSGRRGVTQSEPSKPLQRLSGLRVLVVEDNADNRQIARELLAHEGALVETASDGADAVAKVAAAAPPFDVVLMDLQMPVMDGFMATRKIRGELAMAALPIIAVSANAMESDRRECLNAGMNAHVGKPFALDDLVRELLAHARPHWAVQVSTPAPRHSLGAEAERAAATAGVDLGAALGRLGGKADVYLRLLRNFVGDLGTVPEQLRNCLDGADLQQAARILHTLKGLAATLGAKRLSAAAAEDKLLASGVSGDEAQRAIARVSTAIAAAAPALQNLLAAMQSELGTARPGSARAVDHDGAPGRDTQLAAGRNVPQGAPGVQPALGKLVELLKAADMDALRVMAVLERDFGGALGAMLDPLSEAVAALDFERAESLGRNLMERLLAGEPA